MLGLGEERDGDNLTQPLDFSNEWHIVAVARVGGASSEGCWWPLRLFSGFSAPGSRSAIFLRYYIIRNITR